MSFPRYPAYKPSGVEWLGEVPGTWSIEKFRHLFEESSEKIEKEVFGDMLSVSGYRGIELKQYDDENRRRRNEDLVGYRVVRSGQLVVNTMWLNYAGLGFSELDGHVSPAYRAYWPKTDEDTKYLHYLLRSEHYVKGYTRLLTGVRPNSLQMSRDNMMCFPVILPPKEDQLAIATFLDHETAKIDALIAEQQRLIELLQEKRQAVISHALTKGLNPHTPMKDSGVEWLGEVPAHWRNFRLKALFALKHGYAFDGSQFSEEGEYALMTPGNFIETGGFRRKDPEKYYVGSDMPSEFILQGGEMLIAMTEQAPGLVGTALIAPEGKHYLHNQRLGLVTRLKAEELDTSFLYWLMNSPVLKAKVGVTAAGQKVRHTSPQKILDNEICLPPLEEQRIIAQALFEANERCIKLTENACTSIQLLVERRSALISAAVTGQIDVRGLVPEAVAA
jgi:type I restriction enzyme S subunit